MHEVLWLICSNKQTTNQPNKQTNQQTNKQTHKHTTNTPNISKRYKQIQTKPNMK